MRWIILPLAFTLFFIGLGKPVPEKVSYSGEALIAVREFCDSYYQWRDTAPRKVGLPSLDQVCFDTREMIP